MNKDKDIPNLASYWSRPDKLPETIADAGEPLVCVASSYNFHAKLFETDLLPRFLGLTLDNTESERPFVLEREEALSRSQVSVLVDISQIDPSQSSLRWDQLPVCVPAGIQHSKISLLVWEQCIRIIITSANLTKHGYRRNLEIAGIIDFYNDESSAPLKLAVDVIEFLDEMAYWVRASEDAIERLHISLKEVLTRLKRWDKLPLDFSPRELPRVYFVGGRPSRAGKNKSSPIDQVLSIWGGRRVHELAVMTPFVGNTEGVNDPVIERLTMIPGKREVEVSLIVPGRLHDENSERIDVNLPEHFLTSWAAAWRCEPHEVSTYIISPYREEENTHRDLHAKGIFISNEICSLLFCGSSNFSPRGMGIGAANIEANLCYLDERKMGRRNINLKDRLPVDWDGDLIYDAIWLKDITSIDGDTPADSLLPGFFCWATYNQRAAKITIAFDLNSPIPSEWLIQLPNGLLEDFDKLIGSDGYTSIPADGLLTLSLPESLHEIIITNLKINWTDEKGKKITSFLLVHAESAEAILPLKEFAALTSDEILNFIISGRRLEQFIEKSNRSKTSKANKINTVTDSLKLIETGGYPIYRARRLGRALAVLGERLLKTACTVKAMKYRLQQDPFGPFRLAAALMKEFEVESGVGHSTLSDQIPVKFALAEISLVLAHVGRRIRASRKQGDPDLRPLFRETITQIEQLSIKININNRIIAEHSISYIDSVRDECHRLLDYPNAGGRYAN
jgi:hypothetical protein